MFCYNVFMNKLTHRSLPQRVVYAIGEHKLGGADEASAYTESTVMQEGRKRIGKAAAVAVATVASLAYVGNTIDNSASTQKFKHPTPTTAEYLGHPVYDPSQVQSESPGK